MRQISAFRIKRSKQAVCIFIRALLPRTVWIGKIHFAAKPLLDLAPVRKFRSPVAGNRASAETIAFSIVSALRSGILTAM